MSDKPPEQPRPDFNCSFCDASSQDDNTAFVGSTVSNAVICHRCLAQFTLRLHALNAAHEARPLSDPNTRH